MPKITKSIPDDKSAGLIKALEPLTSRVRTDTTALKRGGKTIWTNDPLNEARLLNHLNGNEARGVCPIKPGENITRVALLDLDSHQGETTWIDITLVAHLVFEKLKTAGMEPIPFRSSGGKGIHLYLLWDKPQDARSVRLFLNQILDELGYRNGTGGVAKKQIEIFPKQDSVPIDGKGNMFILPLAGESVPLDLDLELISAEREYALDMEWPLSAPVPFFKKQLPEKTRPLATTNDLSVITDPLQHIDPDISHDDWIKIGMAIHHETGGSDEGLELWDNWSSGNLKLSEECVTEKYAGREEIEKRWASFKFGRDKPAAIGTIRHLAYKNGWQGDGADDDDFEDLTKRERFQVLPINQFIDGNPPQWIIKNIIVKKSLAMIFGPSGVGKTFLAIDLIMAIALGIAWRDNATKKGRVVYIAAEGVSGIRNRFKAYAKHYGIELDDDAIGAIEDSPNLRADDDKLLAEQICLKGGADIIVIDTLAQTTPGANENSSEDMGLAISRCKRLMEATGAAILLIHHSGKDSSRGARGWSGLKAALDTEIEITKAGTGSKATITKQKDGEAGMEFPFQLHPVTVGRNEEDEPVTSCIIQHTDTQIITNNKPTGSVQKLVYGVIDDLLGLAEKSVSQNAVIEEAFSRTPVEVEGKKRDRRRDIIKCALETLNDNGVIIIQDDEVSLPQSH